jgi:NAD(P)-dependent dehydrogenase (short-subunit alcohol dehydrogenase family)
MDLNGASAIVTGGASGIGAACVRLLAAKGAKVVVADIQEEKGKALADEVGGAYCKVDVTSTQDIMNATEMAKSMGPIRALVNAAGIGWALLVKTASTSRPQIWTRSRRWWRSTSSARSTAFASWQRR